MKICVLRPDDKLHEGARNAVTKFNGICNVSYEYVPSKSLNAAADDVESGRVDVIFLPAAIETQEVNILNGIYRKAKKKPFIIASADAYEAVKGVISEKDILNTQGNISEDFIFNCIRSLLSPPNQKLDIRYIKSIITSVISVVKENTQVDLTPGKIVEQKSTEKPEQVTGVLAFYGDGFLGSLTVSIEYKLLEHFALKMLYCEPADLNTDLMSDVFNEICNQILGVIRTELGEFGYRLVTSLQCIAVNDDMFLHGSSSNGQYYSVPFTASDQLGKFDIVLCYNTYRLPLNELVSLVSLTTNQKESIFDIRLLEAAVSCTTEVISANLGESASQNRICQHLAEIQQSDSLHLFHIGGFEGSVVMGLEIPNSTSCYFFSTMMGMGPDDIEDEGVNDLFGELINQIGGEFVKKVKPSGYSFQRIFHGSYSSKSGFEFLLKNPGLYVRAEININGHPLVLFFGMNSQSAKSYFNAWPYLKAQEKFAEQIVLEGGEPPTVSVEECVEKESVSNEQSGMFVHESDDSAGADTSFLFGEPEPSNSEQEVVVSVNAGASESEGNKNDDDDDDDGFFIS